MRRAPRLLLLLGVLVHPGRVLADVREPPPPPPRGTMCHDQSGLGFLDDEGRCRVGWDGMGEPPDAGDGLYQVTGRRSDAPPVREDRHVRVALPSWVYASLVLTLIAGVALVVRAMRRRPPPP